MAPRPNPAGGLLSRSSYDADAPEYSHVPTAAPHSDSDLSDDDFTGTADALDREVLREEEEREKLLSRGTFLGLIGRNAGQSSVRIGKKVKGRRRRARDVASMMGGKRLGMEDGGEFGTGSGDEEESSEESEDEGLLLGEKEMLDKKPRKPSLRKVLLFSSLLFAFLLVLIFASLSLSKQFRSSHPYHPPPSLIHNNGTHPFHQTTILISLDGLRADYLQRNLTPTLQSMAAAGAAPTYMLPSFPSVTFPNHWTLATGLLPEAHGIVGNTFYDPSTGKDFYYTDSARSLQKHWWGGSPIWQTAERQGLKAAVHMWPGSETPGLGATFTDHYNATERLERKVDRILGWLDLPTDSRPQFIAAYVPNIDSTGHKFGPNTTETNSVVHKVDGMLSRLISGLDSRNLTHIVNVVVVSDHGMATTDKSRMVYLDDLVDVSLVRRTEGWPLFGLRLHNTSTEHYNEIYSHLKKQQKPGCGWSVYLRDKDMPARWHFSKSDRIAPLWIVPDPMWVITTKEEHPDPEKDYEPRGVHGYDNKNSLMRAVFVAQGPSFEELREASVRGGNKDWKGATKLDKFKLRPFQNTEVYGIICKTLGIEAAPHNGTVSALSDLLLTGNVDSDLDSDSDSGSDSDDEKSEDETELMPELTPESNPEEGQGGGAGEDGEEPKKPKIIEVSPGAPPPPEEIQDAGSGWWGQLKSKVDAARERLQKWWNDVWGDEKGKKEGKGP